MTMCHPYLGLDSTFTIPFSALQNRDKITNGSGVKSATMKRSEFVKDDFILLTSNGIETYVFHTVSMTYQNFIEILQKSSGSSVTHH